jgi:hypothetical protein
MGRSANSRNRVFIRTEYGIRTEAFDPAALTDPGLIIYEPVRVSGVRTIVTNGDQTDTVFTHLESGGDFITALRTREFEPDAPHYTPRISALIERDGSYCVSVLKTDGGDPACCCRYFFEYPAALPGTGRFISTYVTDGDPLPSFSGEPVRVEIPAGGLRNFADIVWEALDADNKVALYARETDIETGDSYDLIINKHGSH